MDAGSARFSELFGSFPTPIAIVTAADEEGHPFGFTSNAVCSVSAAEQTLLISVGKGSRTLPAIMSSQAFAVNFLSTLGRTMSQVFASKATDKSPSPRPQPCSCVLSVANVHLTVMVNRRRARPGTHRGRASRGSWRHASRSSAR